MPMQERADRFVANLFARRDHPQSEQEQVRELVKEAMPMVRLRGRRKAVRKFSSGGK